MMTGWFPTTQDSKVPAIGLAVDDTFCSPGRGHGTWLVESGHEGPTSCDRIG
jgi:hypothetical protein